MSTLFRVLFTVTGFYAGLYEGLPRHKTYRKDAPNGLEHEGSRDVACHDQTA